MMIHSDLEARSANVAIQVVPGQFYGQTVQTFSVVQVAHEGRESREDGHGVGTTHPSALHDPIAQAGEVREVLLPGVGVGLEQTARAHRKRAALTQRT